MVVERAGGGLVRPPHEPHSRSILRRLTRDATRILRCDRAGIWRFRTDGTAPRCLTRFEAVEGRHVEDLEYPDTMGEHTLQLLQRIAFLSMEDVATAAPPAPPLQRYLHDEGVRAILAVPIRRDGSVQGFFTFESTNRPRKWDPGDRDHAVSFALQVEQFWMAAGGSEEDRERGTPGEGAPAPGTPAAEETGAREEGGISVDGSGSVSTLRTLPHRSLQVRLRRLRTMEANGILGIDVADAARHLLEVQDGMLSLLDDLLQEHGVDRGLLHEAREAGEAVRDRVAHFREWSHGGSSSHRTLELNALVGSLAVRLGKLTGDRVPLLIGPSPEPLVIRGHPAMLERALEQLVRNAREASREGERVRLRLLRGDGNAPNPTARIVVEDRGEGIRGENLPWIFEPWFTTRRSEGGDGLGLPLVQAVIEGHGGWIDVLSSPGEGTRFSLNVPLAEPLDTLEESPRSPVDGVDEEARPMALVVEDDVFLARLLERVLERAGFQVQRVEGRAGAERVLNRTGRRMALVVAERRLAGGESGLDVIRRARALAPEARSLLVDRRSRAGEAGRGDPSPDGIPLLTPPFEPGDVLALAREMLPLRDRPDDGGDPVH